MEEKEITPEFRIRMQADKPAFPTDFSTSVLAVKWDYHHDTIGKYITNNPLFTTFYEWMRYATKESVSNTPYKNRGVPAELEPFFHEYLSFLLPDHSSLDTQKHLAPEEEERLFALRLFPKAVAAEKEYEQKHSEINESLPSSPDNIAFDSGLYWYRRLYENPYFQNTVSADYWSKEYAWRCKLIEELSLKLPQAQQIHELKTIISYMDVRIAYLLCCVDPSTGQDSSNIVFNDNGFEFTPSFLSTFPMQLINSLRTSNRTVDPGLSYTKRTEYIVPNIPLPIDHPKIKTIGDAINLLTKPSTEASLRETIQTHYLKSVCTVPEKCDFQKASEDLQSYLNLYSTTDHDLEKYNRFIVNCCFRTYRGIMWSKIPMQEDSMGQHINDSALQHFVETSVSNFYNLFYYPIAHIISFIQYAFDFGIVDYCKSHRKAISQLISQGKGTQESLYNSWTDTLKSNLISLWPTELFGPATILDTEFSEETTKYISGIMEEYCLAANQAYEVMISWQSKELFYRAWKRFFETQSPTEGTLPGYGHTLDFLLTAGLLITKTWVSLNYSHQTTLRMFKELTTYINNRNGRPPEATCQDSVTSAEDSKQPDANRSDTGTGQP